jgi:hypothetical protein
MTKAREEAERRYRKSAFLVQAFFRGAQWQAKQPIEITDAMVWKAARALWDTSIQHDMAWPPADVSVREAYRARARIALETALGGEA